MFRCVRNVGFVLCAMAPIVLIPMWVRSYHRGDELCLGSFGDRTIVISSKEGRVTAAFFGPTPAMAPKRWTLTTRPLADGASFPIGHLSDYESSLRFGWIQYPDYVLNFENPSGGILTRGSSAAGNSWIKLTLTTPDGNTNHGTSTYQQSSAFQSGQSVGI